MKRCLGVLLCAVALSSVGCVTGPERVETAPVKAAPGCKCKAKWSEAPPAPGKVMEKEIKDSESQP